MSIAMSATARSRFDRGSATLATQSISSAYASLVRCSVATPATHRRLSARSRPRFEPNLLTSVAACTSASAATSANVHPPRSRLARLPRTSRSNSSSVCYRGRAMCISKPLLSNRRNSPTARPTWDRMLRYRWSRPDTRRGTGTASASRPGSATRPVRRSITGTGTGQDAMESGSDDFARAFRVGWRDGQLSAAVCLSDEPDYEPDHTLLSAAEGHALSAVPLTISPSAPIRLSHGKSGLDLGRGRW